MDVFRICVGYPLGVLKTPLRHPKYTQWISCGYLTYLPIAPSLSSFSLMASMIYELKSKDVLLVALSSAWASKYERGIALRFLALVLACSGRSETRVVFSGSTFASLPMFSPTLVASLVTATGVDVCSRADPTKPVSYTHLRAHET